MSGRDKGRKLFADLANKVRAQVQPSGEPALHARGLECIEQLADDLSGPDGLPGLKVFRDGAHQIRLQRPGRNAQVTVAWVRSIGAVTLGVEKLDRREPEIKYVYREASDEWTRFEGSGELYEDLSKIVAEAMYPEAKR